MWHWLLALGIGGGAAYYLYGGKPSSAQKQGPTPATPPNAQPSAPVAPVPPVPPIQPVMPVVPPIPGITPVAPIPGVPGVQQPSLATVTTSDPPPSGDLVVRSAPDDSATQIGGAEKDGIVQVLNWSAGPNYAQISWGGGSRWPAITGYVHSAYLKPTTPVTS